jgi:hypothetical protein
MAASRREFIALAAQGVLTAAQGPALELEHIKLRVVNSGVSALFYRSLFGGDVRSLRNSTLSSQTRVDEFFLRVGAAEYPYLMFTQLRDGETPGLDHISMLCDIAAARESAVRAGAVLVEPNGYGLRVQDVDGTMVEVMGAPSWRNTGLTLPSNLQGIRPAFEAVALKSVSLGTSDAAKAGAFYRTVFGGAPRLQFRPGAAGLARIEIAIRRVDARKVLDGRGIRAYGSGGEILFKDPDGNEIAVTAV